jgi:hypothetical protein
MVGSAAAIVTVEDTIALVITCTPNINATMTWVFVVQ